MILLCCGQRTPKHFEAMVLFALQLERRGHEVAIDHRFLTGQETKQIKYEIAPFLVDISDISPTFLFVTGADSISDEAQALLAATPLDASAPIWALGHFVDLQEEINARNKIAYATGREPDLYNLTDRLKPTLVHAPQAPLLTNIEDAPVQSDGEVSRLLIYIPHDDAETMNRALDDLSVLKHTPDFRLHLLTNAKSKDLIRKSPHTDLSVFSYSELPPTELLGYFDILVFYGPNVPGERMAALAMYAMGDGKVVIDCTDPSSFTACGAPVLNGPKNPTTLPGYLRETVARNRLEIGRRIQNSDWLRDFDVAAFEHTLGLTAKPAARRRVAPKTLFFPTNGNGLGHAQRCALIAEEVDAKHECTFAAFPSCIDLLRKRGFASVPMVSRSADHEEEYAADLLNYLRLRSVIRAGDQLVFDGGYVFDSVYRLISKLGSPAVWVRRGLWQPGQVHPVALERERAFSKVVVPTEAFAELNSDYSSGAYIHKVGPIVQKRRMTNTEITELREKLKAQFDRPFDTLVISMLGGGVASERTAQTQMLCSLLERRSDCLHLVVAWPDAFVSGAIYGWTNSHVVQTTHAMDLCQAADLTVSAAGYNSFHEVLYAQVPAIFIPQAAPYLDDQQRRATAAHDRGVAALIEETDLLNLEREVANFLDHGKGESIAQALKELALPDTGNAAAAQIITGGLSR